MAQNYDFSDLGGSQVHDFSDLGGTLVPDKAPQQPKQSAFMSGVDAFNAGAERIAHGALQPLLEGPLGERVKRGSQQYHQEQQQLLKQAQMDNPAVAGPAEFAGGIAGASPLYAIPGIGAGLMVRAITQGMLQGGLAGAAQYKNEGDSRLLNAGLGATIGAASYPVARGLSAANPAIKAGTGGLLGLGGAYALGDGSTTDNLIGGIAGAGAPFVPGVGIAGAKKLINAGAEKLNTGMAAPFSNVKWPWEEAAARKVLDKVDEGAAVARKQAADRIGLDYLTPAEASGSPIAGAAQGALSRSKEGGALLFEKGQQRQISEKNAINTLLNDISPDGSPAGEEVRKAAQQYISKREQALIEKAKPMYEKAFEGQVSRNQLNQLTKDPVINDALIKVDKDPVWQRELQGYPLNSVKTLDLVKRNIDDQIERALIHEKGKVPGLMKAKEYLVDTIDNISPDYAKARAVYGQGAKPLEALRNSELAKRIGNLNDVSVKDISKNIFDPTQTDPKVMETMRKQISAENPAAWRSIVRNELERVMDKKDVTGINFYKQNLQGDRRFNQLLAATKDMPQAQQKLKDMREAFKYLIDPNTARNAAGLAKNSMDKTRNFGDQVLEHVKNAAGGKYDKAAVELITSSKWNNEFAEIQKINNKENRAIRASDLLAKIATVGGTGMITASRPQQK